jgi:hypothetical protein
MVAKRARSDIGKLGQDVIPDAKAQARAIALAGSGRVGPIGIDVKARVGHG